MPEHPPAHRETGLVVCPRPATGNEDSAVESLSHFSAANILEATTFWSCRTIDSPQQDPTKQGAPTAIETASPLPESGAIQQNRASLASSRLGDAISWPNLLGLRGIQRTVAAALLSPAAYACHSALSAACALWPYLWSRLPSPAPRDFAEHCTEKQLGVERPAPCSSVRRDSSSVEDLTAALSADETLTHLNRLACVKCPHCSGVFRWHEAERVDESASFDLSVKRPVVSEAQQSRPTKDTVAEGMGDCALQLAAPSLPLQRVPMRELQSAAGLDSCRDAGHNKGGTAECASGVQESSAQISKKRCKPRWIRFLARRLSCIHTSNDRHVIESLQTSQGKTHAIRRRRLHLRRRKRLADEPPGCKDWQARSEQQLAVAECAQPETRCLKVPSGRVSPEEDQDPPRPCSNSCFGHLQHLTSSGAPTSSVVTEQCKSGIASEGTREVTKELSRDAAAAAIATEPSEANGDADQITDLISEFLASCAVPEQQTDQAVSCAAAGLSPGRSLVSLWPMISPECLAVHDIRHAFSKLEEERRRFNTWNRQTTLASGSGSAWNRRLAMKQLSNLLVSATVPSMLVLDCSMPCVHCHDGLQVWKGESGSGNFACRATFLLPLEPRLYAMFASNGELRCQWDKNVTEQHVVEELDPGRDVCYVAFRRIATVHPRDVVTLRVKCRLPVRPKVVQAAGDLVNYHSRGSSSAASDPWSESDAETTAYSSMSCSIDHPKAPENPGRVRMDVRLNAYLAKPVRTPFGLWSEVTLVNESDPGGWIPAAVTRTMCAKLLPSTVEKFSAQIMTHYNIPWTGSAVGFAARKLEANKLTLK